MCYGKNEEVTLESKVMTVNNYIADTWEVSLISNFEDLSMNG